MSVAAPLAQRPPVSPAATCIDLGGIVVGIDSPHGGWRDLARERYGAFAVDRSPDFQITYRVTGPEAPTPDFLHAARQQPLRPGGDATGGDPARRELIGAGFTAWYDRAAGRVSVDGPLATYPLDLLLSALWHERVDRGLIVHAAALGEGSRGWLMSGPSGSGKSTLAGLFPRAALCDEFAAVTIEDGATRLAGLPFWSGRPGAVELEAVYLLRHGSEDRRRRLSSAEAFSRLRPEVAWPTHDPGALSRAFIALSDLVARVPIWELAFRPTPAVWRLITAEAGG